jgi:hypothetical protein
VHPGLCLGPEEEEEEEGFYFFRFALVSTMKAYCDVRAFCVSLVWKNYVMKAHMGRGDKAQPSD